MSNLVTLLTDAYEATYEDRKSTIRSIFNFYKESNAIIGGLVLSSISFVIYIIGSFFGIPLVFIVGTTAYLISILFTIVFVDRYSRKKYKSLRENYYKRMEVFQKLIKEDFKIISKTQLENLITYTDESKIKLRKNENLYRFIKNLLTSMVFPVITSVWGTLDIKSTELFKISIAILIYIVVISLGFILWILIKEDVEYIINTKSHRVSRLNNVLKDIYFLNYVNDNGKKEASDKIKEET